VPQLIEVRVPDIGDYKDVEIIEVAVKPGDRVEVDAALITLETEKATMDVPSTVAGVVREVKVARGGRVSQGDLVVVVEGAGAGGAPGKKAVSEQRIADSAGTKKAGNAGLLTIRYPLSAIRFSSPAASVRSAPAGTPCGTAAGTRSTPARAMSP
jgi:pyruvate/2-oxoglutarate dehydrogenase complex dihydrolipoamide acyltransferase (E2) component